MRHSLVDRTSIPNQDIQRLTFRMNTFYYSLPGYNSELNTFYHVSRNSSKAYLEVPCWSIKDCFRSTLAISPCRKKCLNTFTPFYSDHSILFRWHCPCQSLLYTYVSISATSLKVGKTFIFPKYYFKHLGLKKSNVIFSIYILIKSIFLFEH